MSERYSKIAVSLPPAVLAAADQLAAAQDRSRSWIVAEAIREYVRVRARTDAIPLDAARRAQLQRDLSLRRFRQRGKRTDAGAGEISGSRDGSRSCRLDFGRLDIPNRR